MFLCSTISCIFHGFVNAVMRKKEGNETEINFNNQKWHKITVILIEILISE